MSEEWLDPSKTGDSLVDVVLRRRHEAAYAFARRFADRADVVDVGCGVGYGAGLLEAGPARYVGVDRSLEALRTAASRPAGTGRGFACADVAGTVPLAPGCADLVLAFQIIEHIPVADTPAFLEELRRVCRPDGRVIVTTPNRRHRLLPLQAPWNPYHVREFDREELGEVLEKAFVRVSLMGLRADEEIERVEKGRVGRRRLYACAGPLRRLLPEKLARWIARRLSASRVRRVARREAAPLSADRVSVDRFRVEEDPEGEGLDLVAVCRP